MALKIEDGGDRARPVLMAAALARLGVDSAEVAGIGRHLLYGGGVVVGELRPMLEDALG